MLRNIIFLACFLGLLLSTQAFHVSHHTRHLETTQQISWTRPRHYWRFDANFGSVAENSVDNGPGTVSQATWVGGHASNQIPAIQIDGTDNSYVAFDPVVGQFGTNDFTVALWVRILETPRYSDIVGNRAEGSHGNFFCMRLRSDGLVNVEVDQNTNGLNYALATSGKAVNDGNWHHVAAVRRGATVQVYVDGQMSGQGSGSGVASITTPTALKLGRALVGYEARFAPKAQYSQLRIYDLALSGEEIANLYRYT